MTRAPLAYAAIPVVERLDRPSGPAYGIGAWLHSFAVIILMIAIFAWPARWLDYRRAAQSARAAPAPRWKIAWTATVFVDVLIGGVVTAAFTPWRGPWQLPSVGAFVTLILSVALGLWAHGQITRRALSPRRWDPRAER